MWNPIHHRIQTDFFIPINSSFLLSSITLSFPFSHIPFYIVMVSSFYSFNYTRSFNIEKYLYRTLFILNFHRSSFFSFSLNSFVLIEGIFFSIDLQPSTLIEVWKLIEKSTLEATRKLTDWIILFHLKIEWHCVHEWNSGDGEAMMSIWWRRWNATFWIMFEVHTR
jgi:hypothetical protein